MAQVADQFLACGVLEHGFARVRCHTKRLAIWTQWLDTTLLAPVPHRQVVRTTSKRLRACCLYRRRLLGEIARVAARTVTSTAAIRTRRGLASVSSRSVSSRVSRRVARAALASALPFAGHRRRLPA